MIVTRTIGKKDFPQLQPGPAKVVVTAARPVFYGLRHVASSAGTNIQLRFDPPRIAVISTKHYINLGGSEMIVYRVTPTRVRYMREWALEYHEVPLECFAGRIGGRIGDIPILFGTIPALGAARSFSSPRHFLFTLGTKAAA